MRGADLSTRDSRAVRVSASFFLCLSLSLCVSLSVALSVAQQEEGVGEGLFHHIEISQPVLRRFVLS